MQINISNLSEGVHVYKLSDSAEKLGLENNFYDSVETHVTLEKSMNQLLLKVDASVKGLFICDRCSDRFEDEIKTTFTLVYAWERDDDLGDKDNFFVLRHDENIIDITESVREYLVLAVPLKILCRKKNCEIPGYNKNEENDMDPRWEKLKSLTKK